MDLNNKDGGSRQFIEIEMMDYAETITAERCKIAINGYVDNNQKNHPFINGLPGGFMFYELGESIFDDKGNLNSKLTLKEIKQFIYYTETHEEMIENDNDCYLGEKNSTAFYILYDENNPTILNLDSLSKAIKKKSDSYIIYADSCSLSESIMNKNHIIFKKIPRDIQKI